MQLYNSIIFASSKYKKYISYNWTLLFIFVQQLLAKEFFFSILVFHFLKILNPINIYFYSLTFIFSKMSFPNVMVISAKWFFFSMLYAFNINKIISASICIHLNPSFFSNSIQVWRRPWMKVEMHSTSSMLRKEHQIFS